MDSNSTYYSCKEIRNLFNIHRSNKVTTCSFTNDENYIISKLDNYDGNFEKLIEDVKNFQNNVIKLHKEGKAPKACQNCSMFVKKNWIDKANDKFTSLVLNHYKTCNLKCKHCYHLKHHDTEKDSDNKLVLELIKTLVRKNSISDDFYINLCGGEPSINKFIDEEIN